MEETTTKYSDVLKDEYIIFLNYLKARLPAFHNSNLFFRDFHYAVKNFLEIKNMKVTYAKSEQLAKEFSEFLESKKILIKVSELGWKLNFPDFTTAKPGDPF
ncbi:MAG: hypothetical protein P4L27_13000 [Ignavibacteriaceae bacterium]|jgi:hypothetical protein|nr:hypothetical protein [Ignavibacteriaceae bacterium]